MLILFYFIQPIHDTQSDIALRAMKKIDNAKSVVISSKLTPSNSPKVSKKTKLRK